MKQFRDGIITEFKPFSKYPPCTKDVTFWLPETNIFHSNDLYQVVREVGEDLIEEVKLIDEFKHPKTQRRSHCYRIIYRSMERNLLNQEIDEMQFKVRDRLVSKLNVELR